MYAYILEAALSERSQPDAVMATGEALTVLFECRQHLDSTATEPGMDWSSTALANQVAYDLALIDLARCAGLDCDPSSFDQPQHRRIEVERKLLSCGIRLDELGQQERSSSDHC
jgi:hypothetical protein